MYTTLTTASDRKREEVSREHADNWDHCRFLSFFFQGPSMHDTTLCVVLCLYVCLDRRRAWRKQNVGKKETMPRFPGMVDVDDEDV